MNRSYGLGAGPPRQPVGDRAVALVALVALVGCRLGHEPSLVTIGAGAAAVAGPVLVPRLVPSRRRTAAAMTVVVVLALMAALAGSAWSRATAGARGPYRGPARLVTDPVRRAATVRVVLDVEGQRFEVWAVGSPGRRLEARSAGEVVWVDGERQPAGRSAEHLAAAHVVGRLRVEHVGAWAPGRALDRAANRARALVSAGVRTWPGAEAALFLGLVLGDDRTEPESMVAAFRAAGLAHLTAASGQNIAFVLAAAGPLLRRLRPMRRLVATLGVIGWFVVLTRAEPSVLRAGVMAAIGVTAFTFGRERSPLRVLSLAVGGLLVIDPLLAWSVSFLLSVGATAGLAVLAVPIERALPGPVWLRVPMAVTMAAQLGVAPVALAVFGSLPVVAVPANLLAVPVAGAVMLAGLPVAVAAALLPAPVAAALTWPVLAAVRWVWTVAELGARLDLPIAVDALGWVALSGVLVVRSRKWGPRCSPWRRQTPLPGGWRSSR